MGKEKRIYLSPPHIGEMEFSCVKDAFDKNWISTVGENIEKFEKGISNYVSISACVALNSGTAALHLALKVLGIGKGDEVICSSFTFVASANPILYLGATPIFIDSEEDTWNMSPDLLEVAIKDRLKKGSKPKAIVLVHLYGRPAQIDAIKSIADYYGIPMIEDAAESIGSLYKGEMTGTFGVLGLYSFNGNKIITTSSGGALVSNNVTLIDKAKFLAQQAKDDAIHYQHSELGYNYRMSNVLAGIGCGQMAVLEDRIKKKVEIEIFYKAHLSLEGRFEFLNDMEETRSNKWLTTVLSLEESTVSIIERLEEENIEARPLWKPLHLQPLFQDAPAYIDGTSERIFNKGLCLPSGTAMTLEDMERIVNVVLQKN